MIPALLTKTSSLPNRSHANEIGHILPTSYICACICRFSIRFCDAVSERPQTIQAARSKHDLRTAFSK